MTVSIIDADLTQDEHAAGLLAVLHEYVQLPHITAQPFETDSLTRLPGLLAENPHAHVLLAMSDDKVAGIAVCFLGFSTFAGGPLLNVHDLAVREAFRGSGIGGALLDAAAEKAKALGCLRMTLEVGKNNPRARQLYERKGFQVTQLFMQRDLSPESET